ncbi:C39 family peptidase [Neobacillus sp. LXY-4]|uniref:C39 family peptidase n=1 Tax=Neobacillus sp. LXY-4 TaxID=3379826 RepID=UPI003EE292F4
MKKLYAAGIGALILGFSFLIDSSSFETDATVKISPKVDSTSTKQAETTANPENVINSIPEQEEKVVTEIQLDVPLLNQMDSPRLYNGCEVTSLAMILKFEGLSVTKNELAQAVTRVPLKYSNGEYGNPNSGFVGNMEDGPGLGVYHGPIMDLAKKYVGDRAEDLTGQPFDLLLKKVGEGHPVWIITTSTFAPVSEFQTWQTPQGVVDITYKMHSVVITGFDSANIYINNPFGVKNQKVERDSFIQAWEQMGKQAIVVY